MMQRAFVIVICLLLTTACSATLPSSRPAASGFATGGVLEPYEDGKRHLAAGRYGLAIERFGQALAHDRQSIDAANGLAIAYARLGRFDVAQTYFERALEIDATNVSTLNNYGRALVELGRLRDAMPFFELALRHAAEADLAVIVANIQDIRSAAPPAVVVALGKAGPLPGSGRRLIRLAASVYRLETPPGGLEGAIVGRPVPMPEAAPRQLMAAAILPQLKPAMVAAQLQPVIAIADGAGGLELASAEQIEVRGLELTSRVRGQGTTAAATDIRTAPPSVPDAGVLIAGERT